MTTFDLDWYDEGLHHLADGSIDPDADTLKVMLTTSSYAPNLATHDFRNDVTNEVVGAGYVAGGRTLTNVTVYVSASKVYIDADPVSWNPSTLTVRAAVVYKARGGAASADELLCIASWDEDLITASSNFAITWQPAGFLSLERA